MTDWAQAACLNADPDIMFPDKSGSALPAKRICSGCPLVTDCLEAALANAEAFGIWGATTYHERARIAEMGGWPKPSRDGSAYRQPKCGTEAGYRRHMRADERPCRGGRDCLVCRREVHNPRRHDREVSL